MQEKNEIFDRLMAWSAVFFYSILGIGARIAHMNMGQKITRRQAVTAIFTGLFGGIVCSSICDYYKIEGHLKSAFISISALSGQNSTAWILGNSKDILNRILQILIKKEK
tara:strand:- start:22730 stop:23059 length:330 start_codon:yes stop_codon:yes gene_type:complete